MPEFNECSTMSALQKIHSVVYCQAYSECGQYLAVGDVFGFITVYSLSKALAPGAKKDNLKPYFSYQASDYAWYTLRTYQGLLICGGNKRLEAFRWSDLIQKNAKLAWSMEVPSDGIGLCEVNSIGISEEEGVLYAGCGDSHVHRWDLHQGVYKDKFIGHTDVIQSICISSHQCFSASEDGAVRIWDTRLKNAESQHCMMPSKHDNLARPQLGKWLACLDVDNDLLVCGGGPSLSVWSLRNLSPLVAMDTGKSTHHTVMFYDDVIISGGSNQSIYHWFVNGDKKSSAAVSASAVFSVAVNQNSSNNKVLTACGSGFKIDVFINFNYKSFTLEL